MTSPVSDSIIVVDDEPSIVNLCKHILSMGGYTVQGTSNGEEILRILRNEGSGVRLALLDVRMPGANGIELARRMQGITPGIKVVLMSGQDPAEVAEIAGADNPFPIIWKPFHAESLLRMIENVLKTGAPESATTAHAALALPAP
jgi:DNA-binding NtrC family response regulator